jgi:hypothetical protein
MAAPLPLEARRSYHAAMRPLTQRQILLLTAFVTVVSTVLAYFASHGDWYSTVLTVPLVMSASYWSLRISQRVAARFAAPDALPAPRGPSVEPTSERPDHAQRRRQRRRPRGRRGPVE